MPEVSSEADNAIRDLLAHIQRFCEVHADDRVVAKYSKFFREGYDAYGVPFDVLASEAKRLVKEHGPSLGLAGFLDLADLLMDSGKYEEACFGVHFVGAFRKQHTRDTFRRLGAWFDGQVSNWAVSDSICSDLLGPLLSRGLVGLDDFALWRASSDKWKRRAVPVTLLVLLKGKTEVAPLLEFIGPMMLDKERVVHQGLGWFLREAWRKEPRPVEEFLRMWKDSAARLIFQYATEKMTTEQKARFRRARTLD